MNRRLFAGIFAFFFYVFFTVPAYAAGDLPRLVDEAGLLTQGEQRELLGVLDEISERQQVDVVVVTKNSIDGASAEEYADDFFDANGYGIGENRDGILLLINTEEREWHISTSGYGITVFTDAGLEYMSEQFVDYLSNGEYSSAFMSYARLCDEYITQADAGEAYDTDNLPEEATSFGMFEIAGAFLAAFVISLIATGGMKGSLKSVRSQPMASTYIKNGSMQVTRHSDLFLYRHVDRREKAKENKSSTHTSSSGRSHGGRGGRF